MIIRHLTKKSINKVGVIGFRHHRYQDTHRAPFGRRMICCCCCCCYIHDFLPLSSMDAVVCPRIEFVLRALSSAMIGSCSALSMSDNRGLGIDHGIFSRTMMRVQSRWKDICKRKVRKYLISQFERWKNRKKNRKKESKKAEKIIGQNDPK